MSHKTKSATPEAAETKQLSPETGRMLDVIIALIPAAFAGIAVFGIRAAVMIAAAVTSSVLFEHLYCVIRKAPTTAGDLSAVVTGLILAFSLPVKVPLYIPVFGSAVAVIAVKLLFGGKFEVIRKIMDEVKELPGADNYDIIRSDEEYYEIMPKGIHKGVIIRELRKLLPQIKKFVAVGDNDNVSAMYLVGRIL